jgi:hypothetical protein
MCPTARSVVPVECPGATGHSTDTTYSNQLFLVRGRARVCQEPSVAVLNVVASTNLRLSRVQKAPCLNTSRCTRRDGFARPCEERVQFRDQQLSVLCSLVAKVRGVSATQYFGGTDVRAPLRTEVRKHRSIESLGRRLLWVVLGIRLIEFPAFSAAPWDRWFPGGQKVQRDSSRMMLA